MRQGALIYNPKSGRRRHTQVLGPVLDTLARGGFQVVPRPTGFAGEATLLSRRLAEEGETEVVFAFGGDGTVREVAAGLLGSGTALGVLPGGTANLLARALGLPSDPVAAATLAARMPKRPIDVGLAGSSPFLLMASAGLDGRVLAALDSGFKWRFGRSAVVLQGLFEWVRYPYPELRLVADGEPIDATFAVISNIPFYGGSFRIAPQARLDDGQLQLVAFHGQGRLATISFVLDVMRAAHARRSDVSIRPVREVVLTLPAEASAQVDGDPWSEDPPLHIRLAPEPLLVLAPAG